MPERTKAEQEDRDTKGSLTDLSRTGPQQLIAQALKAEVTELLATYANQRDEQGYARIVLSGHHPKRDIQPGIRPVTVQVPKVRSRQGEPVTFHSALVPPYQCSRGGPRGVSPWVKALPAGSGGVFPYEIFVML